MSDRYPLDPRDEILRCPTRNVLAHRKTDCPTCKDRGYVVGRIVADVYQHGGGLQHKDRFIPAADQRVIEVWQAYYERWAALLPDGTPEVRGTIVGGSTKDEALLSARCAVWGVELDLVYGFYYWRETGGHVPNKRDGFTDPTVALCAAIDAKETE